ncbi:MAG: hypothetical protein HUJ25_00325 [Crocinitomicaceae bacterium]|nr:hypothetical protein [Crocinitomicaceae bacterium]
MVKYLVVIAFVMFGSSLYAQKIKFVATDSLIGDYDQFSVDNFGRIYLTHEDVIVVFSKELDTLFTASLKSIRPTYIESSKSFRTLIFDEERSLIQFLDNTGTPIRDQIDLVSLDIQQPILVCESFGGNTIWVLDAGNLRLIKINEKLQKVLITENLVTIFDGDNLPIQMKESNDYLLVLIPGEGVAKFDVFGTYVDTYPCKAESIDAMGNYLFVRTSKTLEIIPLDGLMEPEYVYDIPEDVLSFAYTRSNVYMKKKNGLYIGNYIKTN